MTLCIFLVNIARPTAWLFNNFLYSNPQDNDGDMLRLQLTNHEPSSGFSVERRQWMG